MNGTLLHLSPCCLRRLVGLRFALRRFMSAFEQRVETPPDGNYQFLLFAAEPYETIGPSPRWS